MAVECNWGEREENMCGRECNHILTHSLWIFFTFKFHEDARAKKRVEGSKEFEGRQAGRQKNAVVYNNNDDDDDDRGT